MQCPRTIAQILATWATGSVGAALCIGWVQHWVRCTACGYHYMQVRPIGDVLIPCPTCGAPIKMRVPLQRPR